jgi:Putative PepSY_TM-like
MREANCRSYNLSVSPFRFVTLLNDLHKGRDTEAKWSAVIDFSAILMSLVSLPGLTLIFFLNKRRGSGLILVAVGALLGRLVYSLWVLMKFRGLGSSGVPRPWPLHQVDELRAVSASLAPPGPDQR